MPNAFCIIGSSFSGSLLGWILTQAGRTVTILDKSVHPRFAIGESSTPLADFLLERIASDFNLPQLLPISRWGSWQRHYPQLRAGKKRGFSYFAHHAGTPFREGPTHEASLLVAASASDPASDTHWMRSDVDHWICDRAIEAGASVVEGADELKISRCPRGWKVEFRADEKRHEVDCNFLIDASGGGGVLGRSMGIERFDDRLVTQTGALFGHFRGVRGMTGWLQEHGLHTGDDPFDADDAAQHHLLENQSWAWMLRFAEGTTSVGIVQPTPAWLKLDESTAMAEKWNAIVNRFPTVRDLMRDANLVGPLDRDGNPQLRYLSRVSRLWSRAAGQSWCMLPSTAGVVDPLHSTGIAHALSGVYRIARILLGASDARDGELQKYSSDVVDEVLWIDRIVSNCYLAAQDSFELFAAVCSLYFVAAIHSERQFASDGEFVEGFLLKDCTPLRQIATTLVGKLSVLRNGELDKSLSGRQAIVDWLRHELQPWNDVGLMESKFKNRIGRSAAPK